MLSTSAEEQNNNSSAPGVKIVKANSFRRRYFSRSHTTNDQVQEDPRQSSFIRPQTQTQPPRSTMSLRSLRSSFDFNSSHSRQHGFLDKNSNHSFPTSPIMRTSSTTSSSTPTPPVSPHRIPIFLRNSMPKSAAGQTRLTGVQQLSTSWEFIR